jgi:hypothetical protein
MKLVKIEGCSYDSYSKIADAIYSVTPFALINDAYRKELRTAFFNFWDTEYIPEKLKKYTMPFNEDLMKILNDKINAIGKTE